MARHSLTADETPVVHRLAIAYLLLPVIIWLVGWHTWWLGVPAAIILVAALWQSLRGSWQVSLQPLTLVLLLLALVWVMATAAGGVFDVNNFDWLKHRAVLLDLVRGTWPVHPPTLVSGLAAYLPVESELPRPLLRYYLGYYLVPSLLAKWLGISSLNILVPLWTWGGVALIMLMFTRGLKGWKALGAVAVLIFFSGMDLVRVVLAQGWDWLELDVKLAGWPHVDFGLHNLEWGSAWSSLGEYVSFMHSLMWVPQHFVPGAMFALLLLQMRHHERFLNVSGVVIGASIFWSPFVAIGLLPLVGVLLLQNGMRPFLRWQNLVLALPLVALLSAYLISDSPEVSRGWLWEVHPGGWQAIVRTLPQLYLTEFLALAIVLVLLRPQLLREPWFGVCVATLLLLPWYSLGKWNDLVVRGLIPAQMLLCYFCAHTILAGRSEALQGARAALRAPLVGLVAVMLGLGAVSPLIDLTRANNDHDSRVARYAQLGPGHSILFNVSPEFHSQYVAYETAGWYRGILRENGGNFGFSPQGVELIASSEFDVYLVEGRAAAFAKSPCKPEDVAFRFILHVSSHDAEIGSHQTLDFDFEQASYFWVDDTCLTAHALPDYDIGVIRVGQFNQGEKGHRWLRNYYAKSYRDMLLQRAGAPRIRAEYEVYLFDRRLIYSKMACEAEDLAASFSLRIVPQDVQDLPSDSRQQGFQVIGFNLKEHGGKVGQDCLVMHDLPDYRVLGIRTGQNSPGGGYLWQGAIELDE